MGNENEKKAGGKRSRSYYKKCMHKKRKKWNSMDIGMRGFLVTCNQNESQAVKEMYNLLNEYADRLYGPEHRDVTEKTKENSEDSDHSDGDIQDELEKEVNALKEKIPAERRFQQLDSGTKNCLFIKTTLEKPCELIHHILNDIYETQIQKTRYSLRVLPVSTVCRIDLEDITKVATDLLDPFFSTPFGVATTYGISFKARMSSKLSRDEVIRVICHIIEDMNPLNKVNYNRPDFIVVVELLRGFCCLSVVKDFNKFRKYNLQETSRAQQRLAENVSETTQKQGDKDNSSLTDVEIPLKSNCEVELSNTKDKLDLTTSKGSIQSSENSETETCEKTMQETG
ncbi:THUMP domain-containing protein 1-like [Argonauta hians]